MTRQKTSRVTRRPLMIESLESRRLMTAALLQDINSDGLYPEPYCTIDGWTYFRSQDPSGVNVLERTDGAGTTQVVERYERDGAPTHPISVVAFQGSIVELVQGSTTLESWISKIDTTTLQISKTLPLWPDQAIGRYSNNLTVVNDQRLIFTDYSLSTYSAQLYGIDGNLDGPVLLTDKAGSERFEHIGSSVVFLDNYGADGHLWITDGTLAGTRQLVAEPGVLDYAADGDRILYSHGRTSIDTTSYVASVDAAGNIQILVDDVFVDKLAGSPDGTGYFTTQTQPVPADLYITDGTTAGTRYVTTVPWDAAPNLLVQAVVGDKAYMTSTDPETGNTNAVWVSDGTAAGTFQITPDDTTEVGEVPTGFYPYGFPTRQYIHGVGGRAFFAATVPSLGSELWTSDGTPAGTHAVADLFPGPQGSEPLYETATPDGLLFAAHELGRAAGIYLASPDGSTVTTVAPLDNVQTLTSLPTAPVTVAGKTFFLANAKQNESRTWVTDGTPAGTFDLSDQVPGLAGLYCIPIGTEGDRALLKTISSDPAPYTKYTYWISDGTPSGTVQISGVPSDAVLIPPYDPTHSVVIGSQTFSIVKHDDGSQTLQVVDASTGVTTTLKSFPSGPIDRFPTAGVAFGGKYYYLVPGGPGRGLYVSDGTVAGTLAVVQPTATSVDGLAVVGDQLTFILSRDSTDPRLPPGLVGGNYLMASNGTFHGTYMLSRLGPSTLLVGGIDQAITQLANGKLLVFADDGLHGTEPMVVTPDVPPPPYLPTPSADLSAPSVAVLTAKSATVVIPATTPATPPAVSTASVSAESPTTTVQGVEPVIRGRQIRSLSIRVSGPLDSASANMATSYRVIRLVSGRHGTFRRQVVPVRSASYDATSHTVTLMLRRRVPLGSFELSTPGLLDSHRRPVNPSGVLASFQSRDLRRLSTSLLARALV